MLDYSDMYFRDGGGRSGSLFFPSFIQYIGCVLLHPIRTFFESKPCANYQTSHFSWYIEIQVLFQIQDGGGGDGLGEGGWIPVYLPSGPSVGQTDLWTMQRDIKLTHLVSLQQWWIHGMPACDACICMLTAGRAPNTCE